MPHFAVVELNGALILIAAMNSLHFLFALDFLANLWRGNGQRYQDDSRDEQQANQQIALLPRTRTRMARNVGHGNTGERAAST